MVASALSKMLDPAAHIVIGESADFYAGLSTGLWARLRIGLNLALSTGSIW